MMAHPRTGIRVPQTLKEQITWAKAKLDVVRQTRDPLMIALAENTLNHLLEKWDENENKTPARSTARARARK